MSLPPTYPPMPAPQAPPPNKSNAGLIVGIIAGVVLLVCVACGGLSYLMYGLNRQIEDRFNDALASVAPDDPARPSAGDLHTVRYEVHGTGTAAITWSPADGGRKEIARLPWSKEVTVNGPVRLVLVTAIANQDAQDTQIDSCRILLDGSEIVQMDTADGTGRLVSCNKVLGY